MELLFGDTLGLGTEASVSLIEVGLGFVDN